MKQEITLAQSMLDRLSQIEETLRRICWEKDLLLAAVADLLRHHGLGDSASRLQAAIDQLYAERSAAAAERRAMQDRDTLPPESP